MAGETQITVIGNLTADPELRFTNSGVPLATFTVASTPKVWDRQANELKDGEALFLRCTVWRDMAENVAASLTKGARVVVVGNLMQRNYEHEGQRRTSYEVTVDEVAPSLRWATAQVTRAQRDRGGSGAGSVPSAGEWSSAPANGAQNASWASSSEAPF